MEGQSWLIITCRFAVVLISHTSLCRYLLLSQENYGTDLAGGAHIGNGIPGSFSGDGHMKKHPLEFEPVSE